MLAPFKPFSTNTFFLVYLEDIQSSNGVDIGLLVGGVDLGTLFVDRRKKGGQQLELKTLCNAIKKPPRSITNHPSLKKWYLLARLFSSSILPLRWLEVVQASVKAIPLTLSEYLVSRSPTMIPLLLSRWPLILKVYYIYARLRCQIFSPFQSIIM